MDHLITIEGLVIPPDLDDRSVNNIFYYYSSTMSFLPPSRIILFSFLNNYITVIKLLHLTLKPKISTSIPNSGAFITVKYNTLVNRSNIIGIACYLLFEQKVLIHQMFCVDQGFYPRFTVVEVCV